MEIGSEGPPAGTTEPDNVAEGNRVHGLEQDRKPSEEFPMATDPAVPGNRPWEEIPSL